MSKKFTEYAAFDLSAVNKEVLERWKQGDIFHKSLETRKGHPSFVFYEGPPSANGMPGIHHVIARSIKDIFCRYKTMKGFLVNRKAGWDTHGLPVELGVEKSLGITKADIGKKQDFSRRVQRHLPQRGDEVHRRVAQPHREDRLLGGYGRPLHHLRQPLHRDTVVSVEGTLQEGLAL